MTITHRHGHTYFRALQDRQGVSATEYTVMVVGIAAMVLAGASTMGNRPQQRLAQHRLLCLVAGRRHLTICDRGWLTIMLRRCGPRERSAGRGGALTRFVSFPCVLRRCAASDGGRPAPGLTGYLYGTGTLGRKPVHDEAATSTVAVIGGGPAGLIAAEVLAQAGQSVTVYDQMPSVGRKLLMAGRGGLNLTHAETAAAVAVSLWRGARPARRR